MSRQLIVACLVYFSVTIQPSLSAEFGDLPYRPWMPGIGLAVIAVILDSSTGLFWSAILGLGVDCLSGERLGIHLIMASLIAACLFALRGQKATSVCGIGTMCFLGTFLWRSQATICRNFLEQRSIELFRCGEASLFEALSTALLLSGVVFSCRLFTNGIQRRSTPLVSLSNRWSMLTDG